MVDYEYVKKVLFKMAYADLRSIGRPGNFDGEEEKWQEWGFGMKTYFTMAQMVDATALTRVEGQDE